MMTLSLLFSVLIIAPLSITLLYRTNLFGKQDLSRYYSLGHSLYNNLPLIYLGLATAQAFVGCYYFAFHYCPFLFSFKPWVHKWADLSALLLEDSIFGDLFIDVEGRYTSGDLILYDKTKIFRYERILHTFDAQHMYYLKARNNYTGIFMLDLIKPKSLTLYELVKNTEFSIEPFKFSSNATVNHIPNGFREVPGFLFYPIDPETRTFQIYDESFALSRLTGRRRIFCHENIVYRIFSTEKKAAHVPDSHFPRAVTLFPKGDFLQNAVFDKTCSTPLLAQKLLRPTETNNDFYIGSSYKVYQKF